MLLLNPIVRKTSEKRSRWWTRLAGFGLWSVLQPICMSLNIRSIKEEHDDVYTVPFLVALWHNRTMVPGYAWSLAQKPLKMSVLTSASKDGALVEAVCRHFGLGAVRGSSGRRGALAYMEMMRKVQEGDVCFCFTPDGPRGPIYEVHHGIVKLASQSGLPIVPVCIEYESCWRLNKTWDRYAIPKPCSNVNILWKKRLFIPPDATDEQVAEIVRSADKYLYCDAMGGYRLNTDFGEVKMDLGRMFGFAYGEKENGAVFSHMAVMFANALYKRGFVKEGHRALDALYRQSVHFETSRIYPGIPEYFNSRGKGMYHYLTGAASWYMLTVITEMFGAKGCAGNLMLEPKLERQQFDLDERAELFFSFAGQSLHLVYENKEHKEYGAYRPGTIRIDGELWDYSGGEKETRSVCIDRERLKQLDFDVTHEILVELV